MSWMYVPNHYGDMQLRRSIENLLTILTVAAWVAVIGGVVCGCVYGIALLWRSANRADCHAWSAKTGLHTSFRINHFLAGGTCFVTLPNGKVAPTGNIQYRVNGG